MLNKNIIKVMDSPKSHAQEVAFIKAQTKQNYSK